LVFVFNILLFVTLFIFGFRYLMVVIELGTFVLEFKVNILLLLIMPIFVFR